MATKKEKDNYDRLARFGCALCNALGYETADIPSEMHHIRRFGQKRSSSAVIPLCAHHHRLGNTSLHALGHKGFATYWGFSEEDLCERMERKLSEQVR